MSSAEVIEQIKRLPQEERRKVIEYAREADPDRLTAGELEDLAGKLAEAKSPAEIERLTELFVHGFYGNEPHA